MLPHTYAMRFLISLPWKSLKFHLLMKPLVLMSISQAVTLMNRLRSKSSGGRAQQSQSSGEDSGGASGRHSHTNGTSRPDEASSGSRSNANRKADGHGSSSGVNQRSRPKEAENPQVTARVSATCSATTPKWTWWCSRTVVNSA